MSRNRATARVERISVLVEPDGNVVKVYPDPDAEHHALEVLEDLGG